MPGGRTSSSRTRAHAFPYFVPVGSPLGREVVVDGEPKLMFGSNNYLGLADDPRVAEAARRAVDRYGTGCTGSRLMNGTLDLHLELEHELADWMQREAALVFTAGYLANLATIATLCGPGGRHRHRREEPRVDRGRRAALGRAGRAGAPQRPRPARGEARPARAGRAGDARRLGLGVLDGGRRRRPAPAARGQPRRRRAHAGRRGALARAVRSRRRGHVHRAGPRCRPRDGHVQQVARVVRRGDRRRRRRDRAPPHPRPPVRLHRVGGARGGRCGPGGGADLPGRAVAAGADDRARRRASPTGCARSATTSRSAAARSSRCACPTSGRRRSRGGRCSRPAIYVNVGVYPGGPARRGAPAAQHHVRPTSRPTSTVASRPSPAVVPA